MRPSESESPLETRSTERRDGNALCPNCGAQSLAHLYSADQVPAQSAILLESREEALAFPRGRLNFAQCGACQFITNLAFDESLVAYDDRYEGSQMASPTFARFANEQAARLIDAYGLHGKPMLEIGCGQGEFLSMICELSDSPGIGYDPAFRGSQRLDGRVDVRASKFDEHTPVGDAACIICRHTLEHLPRPRQFVQMLRGAIGDRSDVTVLIEVPDVERILQEGAFWDLFYEHCSNFTQVSLEHVFRNNGFDVRELNRAYAGQYLVLIAQPAFSHCTGGGPGAPQQTQNNPGCLRRGFRRQIAETIEYWNTFFSAAHARGETIALWGSGSKAVGFLTSLRERRPVRTIVDINPARHGKFMPGVAVPICSPESLRSCPPDTIIIMNPVYREEIERDLRAVGLSPRVEALAQAA